MASSIRALSNLVFFDLIGSVIRFPLWWYTDGSIGVIHWLQRSLRYRWRAYALGLWIRNFFVPMYGAYDWRSRLVSLVMRTVVILARLFALFVEILFLFSLLVLWFFAPIVCLLFLLLNLSVGFSSFVSTYVG